MLPNAMKLITICNYQSTVNTNILCAWWLHQALINSDLTIEIWYKDKINNPLLPVDHGRVKLVKKDYIDPRSVLKECYIDSKAEHNIGFKLYNLCLENEAFIYLDMDAILLKRIEPLLSASQDKPVIMVNHQSIVGHTANLPGPIKHNFLNSGVQVVSDTRLLDFRRIVEAQNARCGYIVPGYDQAMLYNYFSQIGYDYTHPQIDYTWNNAADTDTPIDLININHYWVDMKPWKIGCPLWDNFKSTKLHNYIDRKYSYTYHI
jgi:hypothetical protein